MDTMVNRPLSFFTWLLLLSLWGANGCSRKVMDLNSKDFNITAYSEDWGALDEGEITVTFRDLNSSGEPRKVLIVMPGFTVITGRFLDDSLVLLTTCPILDSDAFACHFLLRLPAQRESPPIYAANHENLYPPDSSAYSRLKRNDRTVKLHKSGVDAGIRIVELVGPPAIRVSRILVLPSVKEVSAELIGGNRLKLVIEWVNSARPDSLVVGLPTSEEQDLRYEWLE
jgi:hypothetical protein